MSSLTKVTDGELKKFLDKAVKMLRKFKDTRKENWVRGILIKECKELLERPLPDSIDDIHFVTYTDDDSTDVISNFKTTLEYEIAYLYDMMHLIKSEKYKRILIKMFINGLFDGPANGDEAVVINIKRKFRKTYLLHRVINSLLLEGVQSAKNPSELTPEDVSKLEYYRKNPNEIKKEIIYDFDVYKKIRYKDLHVNLSISIEAEYDGELGNFKPLFQ